MSTRKRRDPRSLEPEAPDMYEAPSTRPPTGQKPIDLEAVIGNAVGTVLMKLIESGRSPSSRPTPGPIDRVPPAAALYPDAPIYRDVRYTPIADLVLARCEAAPPVRTPLCGERYVPRRWINCPYCGHLLQAPVQ